jgi:ATP/ADP translocase
VFRGVGCRCTRRARWLIVLVVAVLVAVAGGAAVFILIPHIIASLRILGGSLVVERLGSEPIVAVIPVWG